jgi:hypothetical protein
VRLLLIFLLHSVLTEGQNVIGKYTSDNPSHTNSRHYEELTLKSDSTFTYYTTMEFIRIRKEGRWSTAGDTLVLNERNPCCTEKIIVKEVHNRRIAKGRVTFVVTSLLGGEIDYHLVLMDGDSLRTIWSRTGVTEVDVRDVKKFYFIVNSLVYSPEYYIRSSRSNQFDVQLAPNRIFYNEKWLLKGKNEISPLGWDNIYSKYYLERKE